MIYMCIVRLHRVHCGINQMNWLWRKLMLFIFQFLIACFIFLIFCSNCGLSFILNINICFWKHKNKKVGIKWVKNNLKLGLEMGQSLKAVRCIKHSPTRSAHNIVNLLKEKRTDIRRKELIFNTQTTILIEIGKNRSVGSRNRIYSRTSPLETVAKSIELQSENPN